MFKRTISVFLVLIFPGGSLAEGLSFSVSAYLEEFFYREYTENREQLNRERGWIPGINLSAEYRFSSGISTRLRFEKSSGNVDYFGKTNFGNLFSTTTDETFWRYVWEGEYRPAYHLPAFKLMFSHNRWNRDIQPRGLVRGLYEEYYWNEGRIGLNWIGLSREDWFLVLEGSFGYTANPHMKVDLRPQGFGIINLTLEEAATAEAQLAWYYRLSDATQFYANAKYSRWRFDASEAKEVSSVAGSISVREPDSKTALLHFGIGVKRNF